MFALDLIARGERIPTSRKMVYRVLVTIVESIANVDPRWAHCECTIASHSTRVTIYWGDLTQECLESLISDPTFQSDLSQSLAEALETVLGENPMQQQQTQPQIYKHIKLVEYQVKPGTNWSEATEQVLEEWVNKEYTVVDHKTWGPNAYGGMYGVYTLMRIEILEQPSEVERQIVVGPMSNNKVN